ncbi:MAG: T9SS type A sorting domain-containing protein [Flavobacterium sp.]
MKFRRILKLLFVLVFLQFKASAQYSSGLTVISSGTADSSHEVSPVTFSTPITVTGNLVLDPSTTLTVSGTVLTVTEGINLGADSVLYLRNGAQLIQTHSGASKNEGTGTLSVYQEGTVDNYEFNYWCSPVGTTASTTVNNPFGITLLGRPVTVTATSPAIILPNNQYDGVSNPLSIAPYWINTFKESGSYSQWNPVGSASVIEPGYGFTMKGVTGTDTTVADPADGVQNNPGGAQRYDFRGKPNDGEIPVAVSAGVFTLVGNPYPSAVRISSATAPHSPIEDDDNLAFLTDDDNQNNDGNAYYWEQDQTVNSHYLLDYVGGYGIYTGFSNLYAPAPFYLYDASGNPITYVGTNPNTLGKRKYAPIGQGFMIRGKDPGGDGSDHMRNRYRAYVKESTVGNPTDSEFARGGASSKKENNFGVPHVRFNAVLDNGPISQIVLSFLPKATDGIDKGMDAKKTGNYPANVNFFVAGTGCVINAVPFDIDRKFPLIFENKSQANYKIGVNEIVNLDAVSNVYLHDKKTDQYHDIKNDFYELILPKGTNYSQFEITFKNNALGVDEMTIQSFVVYQNELAKKLMINNPEREEIAVCELYDVAGKLIFRENKIGNVDSYAISTADLVQGVYILRLTSENKKTFSQKVIVRN